MTVSSTEQSVVAWNQYGNYVKGKLKALEKLFKDVHSYRRGLCLPDTVLFPCSIYVFSRWCLLLEAPESQR